MKVQKDFVIRIGGNEFAETPHLLASKGKPLVTVGRDDDSEELTVALDVYDEKGRKKATIRNDKLVKGSAKVFEIRTTENSYTVYDHKHERTICKIRRRGKAQEMDLDVSLLLHTPEGFLVHANPEQTNLRTRASEDVIRGRDAALKIN